MLDNPVHGSCPLFFCRELVLAWSKVCNSALGHWEAEIGVSNLKVIFALLVIGNCINDEDLV